MRRVRLAVPPPPPRFDLCLLVGVEVQKRLKVLGEALGHVDAEDGVLVKVYDDIQTELSEKTAALKKMKQRVKGLNTEIR